MDSHFILNQLSTMFIVNVKDLFIPDQDILINSEICKIFLFMQIENQNKMITDISQQPTCNPVFKRFLRRLLKEVQGIGVVGGLYAFGDELCSFKPLLHHYAALT